LDYIDTGYSFCYSPRPGTPASVADNQIPEEVKKQRLHEIQEALIYKQLQRNQADVGKTMSVLVEKTGKKENQMTGRSPYLQSVCFQGKSRLLGCIVDIRITEGYANTLAGDIVTMTGVS
jgi:tRNA-2-methylthio-N6-dimethylallyladenosine synthase